MVEFDLGETVPDAICRDERCERADIHSPHMLRKRLSKRPPKAPEPEDPGWSAIALSESILRLVNGTHFAVGFSDVFHHVLNDYGSTTRRAVHRHLRRLVDKGDILQVDLGYTLAVGFNAQRVRCAYLNIWSRWIRDRDVLREALEGRGAGFSGGIAGAARMGRMGVL